jgi:hypothetical protein
LSYLVVCTNGSKTIKSSFGRSDDKESPDDIDFAVLQAAWECVEKKPLRWDWANWCVEIRGNNGNIIAQRLFPPVIAQRNLKSIMQNGFKYVRRCMHDWF